MLLPALEGRTRSRKKWRIKKLENLVQNRSIGSIVCARPTAAPRNGRRDNAVRIMTIWWTSPYPILQIHSLHQVAMGTPSHVPLQRRAIIIVIFRGSGTNCMVPSDWDSALRCVYGPNFTSVQHQNSTVFSAAREVSRFPNSVLIYNFFVTDFKS